MGEYIPTIYGYRLHSSWHRIAMNAENNIDESESKCEEKKETEENEDDKQRVHLMDTIIRQQSTTIAKLENEIKCQQMEFTKLKQLNNKYLETIASQKMLIRKDMIDLKKSLHKNEEILIK